MYWYIKLLIYIYNPWYYRKERIFDPKLPTDAEKYIDKSIIEVAATCNQTVGKTLYQAFSPHPFYIYSPKLLSTVHVNTKDSILPLSTHGLPVSTPGLHCHSLLFSFFACIYIWNLIIVPLKEVEHAASQWGELTSTVDMYMHPSNNVNRKYPTPAWVTEGLKQRNAKDAFKLRV